MAPVPTTYASNGNINNKMPVVEVAAAAVVVSSRKTFNPRSPWSRSVLARALATKGTPISFTTPTTPPSLLVPGTYKTQIAPIPVKPVVIPFVTPASPFVPPPPHHLPHLHPQPLHPPPHRHHPHQHINPTPASPFSPQESHSSNSVSPISHPPHGPHPAPQTQMSDPALAAAAHSLHLATLPTRILDHSHPSHLSSHPSPSPNGVPSPHNPHFPFPPGQALSRADRPPLHVQAQLPLRTTPPTLSAVSVEDLDWYYPQQQQHTPTDPQNWSVHRQDMAPPLMPLTPQSAVDTTPHFLSTHRRSPTSLSSHGSDHSLESTMMTANGSVPQQAARSLDPNLADSPSWNSAMTQMQIQPPDHFYHFQQGRVPSQAQGPSRVQVQPQRASLHSQSPIPPLRTNSRTGTSHPFAQEFSRHQQQQQEEAHIRAFQAQARAQQARVQAQAQARVEAQSPAQAHGSQDEFTSNSSTSRAHPYSATSYPHPPYFGMVEPPPHHLPYGQSQVGPGSRPRTPPQGPAPGQMQALHAVTARPNLAGNGLSKFDSRSLLPTPPLL